MNIDSQNLESYVPVYDVVPEKWEDARIFLVEQLKRLAYAVNIREIGWFLDIELLSGKAFIPGANDLTGGTSQQFRQVLRKVINFGALPNTAIKSVPHGILFDSSFTLVFMGAYATDPVNLTARPIPFATPVALNQNISMYMDATKVYIQTGIDYSSNTRCFVTIEYMQEV